MLWTRCLAAMYRVFFLGEGETFYYIQLFVLVFRCEHSCLVYLYLFIQLESRENFDSVQMKLYLK